MGFGSSPMLALANRGTSVGRAGLGRSGGCGCTCTVCKSTRRILAGHGTLSGWAGFGWSDGCGTLPGLAGFRRSGGRGSTSIACVSPRHLLGFRVVGSARRRERSPSRSRSQPWLQLRSRSRSGSRSPSRSRSRACPLPERERSLREGCRHRRRRHRRLRRRRAHRRLSSRFPVRPFKRTPRLSCEPARVFGHEARPPPPPLLWPRPRRRARLLQGLLENSGQDSQWANHDPCQHIFRLIQRSTSTKTPRSRLATDRIVCRKSPRHEAPADFSVLS